MDPSRPRSAHPVVIADHLWETFEDMARSMGSDRDALINQAMFMFARANGFVEGRRSAAAAASKTNPAGEPPNLPASAGPDAAVRAHPPEAAPVSPEPRHDWAADSVMPPGAPTKAEDDSSHRRVAERVLQTAAELERMIKSKSEVRHPPSVDGFSDLAHAANSQPAVEGGLFIVTEDGQSNRVAKDRFLIGRGKHCDFVISSGKVSREHAAIVREGTDYFIEDLGSSNGTWFNKQRIKRRKISDGDEYLICSDKIKLVLR